MKSLFKLGLAVISLWATSVSLHAQLRGAPASLTLRTGDTLTGVIHPQSLTGTLHTIQFQQASDEAFQNYNPQDVESFQFYNQRYIGGFVAVETSPRRNGFRRTTAALEIDSQWVFLQVLVDAERGLYTYHAPRGNDLFYILQEGEFQLLSFKEYLAVSGKNFIAGPDGEIIANTSRPNSGPPSRSKVLQNNRYKGELHRYMADWPNVVPKLERTRYTKRDLIRLFSGYLKSTNRPFVLRHKLVMPKTSSRANS
ncbi:hypothetical protein [Pontibacter sp. G13]|uniref:hypothetical protein n=1 Tax=Pontibacter sp. G13 TaxID=3074898 RepID=UPI00288BE6F1|nr:hypothetical protein [Pontibacter sp. G13]WNJ18145.1 hypothetical protein RJD25_25110 [Pontibacter sp. G13]